MSDHIDREQLSAYADSELEAQAAPTMEAHLAACPSCRAELIALRRLAEALASSPRKTMPAALMARLEKKYSLRPSWGQRVRNWAAAPTVWIPAGSLAVAALSLFLWLGGDAPGEENAVPLEALLAAHSRYSAESAVPNGNLVNSEFFTNLAAYHAGK